MIEMDYVISHPVGLYAKVAEGLVDIANQYEAEVTITYKSKKVSMKSLMGVISLGVPANGTIHLCIHGKDAVSMEKCINRFLKDCTSFFLLKFYLCSHIMILKVGIIYGYLFNATW